MEIKPRENANGFKLHVQNMKFVTERQSDGRITLGLLKRKLGVGMMFTMSPYFSKQFSEESLLKLCYELTAFFQISNSCAYNIVANDPYCAEVLVKHHELIRDKDLLYKITETGANFWQKNWLSDYTNKSNYCLHAPDDHEDTIRYLSLAMLLHENRDAIEKEIAISALKNSEHTPLFSR